MKEVGALVHSEVPAPRMLFLPNEPKEGDQPGPRRAVNAALLRGVLSAVCTLPLLSMVRDTSVAAATEDLVRQALDFQPDVVLIFHPSGTGLTQQTVEALLGLRSRPTLVYYEADPYSQFSRPLPAESRILAKYADVVYTVGAGSFERVMKRAGAREVRYSGHRRDEFRFPLLSPSMSSRQFEVSMVANRDLPLRPWRILPGSIDRIRLASRSARKWGEKFALYGRGWRNVSARGPCSYADQAVRIGQSWVNINWDHFPREPAYFSDRLPISLSSGAVHITTWHPGYETLFADHEAHGLFFEQTIKDVLGRAEVLLRSPRERLAKLGRAAQHYGAWMTQANEFETLIRDVVQIRVNARLGGGTSEK